MRRKTFLLLSILIIAFFSVNIYSVSAENIYYLGGIPAGFELKNNGVIVVGFTDVLTEDGIKTSPSKDAGIEINDTILSINGEHITSVKDIEKNISKGLNILKIKRRSIVFDMNVKSIKDVGAKSKLGIFVKNDVNGIGTITFISNNRFASLGHPIYYNDEIMDFASGNLYNCNITGCVKGEYLKPGELKGFFIKEKLIGSIDKNLDCGVYGTLNQNYDIKKLKKIQLGEAKIGEASIYTTIDGLVPKEYDISIVKIDSREKNNKNFVIKVNDKALIEEASGIVQGMSGSPIVQNGRLVGAVTHVFTNDSTRGFGISIENMINK